MNENTQEPPEFTAHADEMQWRGIYRDWALAGWTASRLQAIEECAKVCDTQAELYVAKMEQAHQAGRPERKERMDNYRDTAEYIAAAIRALGERKDA